MKLIVGLGNSGEKYAKTRHNLGFRVVETWLAQNSLAKSSVNVPKLEGEIVKLGADILVLKPGSFMNRSGPEVKKTVDFLKINLKEVLVVHDELDLFFGDVKLQFGRGSAGHNGVRSVIESLGTDEFHRLRVGIGRPLWNQEIEEWVLKPFDRPEADIQALIDKGVQFAADWVQGNTPA